MKTGLSDFETKVARAIADRRGGLSFGAVVQALLPTPPPGSGYRYNAGGKQFRAQVSRALRSLRDRGVVYRSEISGAYTSYSVAVEVQDLGISRQILEREVHFAEVELERARRRLAKVNARLRDLA